MQNNINQLLAAGIADAKQFSKAYVSPTSSGIIYSLSNGWFNTAKTKGLGHFKISIAGNAASVSNANRSFLLNADDYTYLKFKTPGNVSQPVATALGQNNPDIKC